MNLQYTRNTNPGRISLLLTVNLQYTRTTNLVEYPYFSGQNLKLLKYFEYFKFYFQETAEVKPVKHSVTYDVSTGTVVVVKSSYGKVHY